MLRRAVFSDVQRKALEKMFQKQKYISKPDRKKLASKLGLKDSQVRKQSMVTYLLGYLAHFSDSETVQVLISYWLTPTGENMVPEPKNEMAQFQRA